MAHGTTTTSDRDRKLFRFLTGRAGGDAARARDAPASDDPD
jgi:hypothetical protein